MTIQNPVSLTVITAPWGRSVADELNLVEDISSETPITGWVGSGTVRRFGRLFMFNAEVTATQAFSNSNVNIFQGIAPGYRPADQVAGVWSSAVPNGGGAFTINTAGNLWARSVTTNVTGTSVVLTAMWLRNP